MSPKKKILEHLKEHGFSLKRSGKHDIYTNGKWDVTMPSGGEIGDSTLKACLQHIEGRGPFYNKQQEQIRNRLEKEKV